MSFSDISSLSNVNMMTVEFNRLIVELFDKYAPLRTVVLRKKHIPWLTSNVKLMIQLRNQADENFKLSKTDSDLEQYENLKSTVNIALYCEKKAFFEQNINININDSSTLWKKLKQSVLPNFKHNLELPGHFDDPNVICDEFARVPGITSCQSRNCLFMN